jgi:hypothetical protein
VAPRPAVYARDVEVVTESVEVGMAGVLVATLLAVDEPTPLIAKTSKL